MKSQTIIPEDLKSWYALSCPTAGLRFDKRTLELLDCDGDGFIRTPEVKGALEWLGAKGVTLKDLFAPLEADAKKISDITQRQAALDREEPSQLEKAALAEWEEKGKSADVAVLGDATAAAEAALSAVESTIDAFFTPSDDMPLVTEEADVKLPLKEKLNPRYLEAILDFSAKCVAPFFGEDKTELTRIEWKEVKSKFVAYRAWIGSKPVMCADARANLDEEEKLVRFRYYLGEFLHNFITMDRLYANDGSAIFQTGVLRLDGREMNLCFHVANEAAHSALVGKSNCCVLYLKLSRPAEKSERQICAVVTAGRISTLYVGRNGVFYDRDGNDWQATITKIVENQVSLGEAFWSPWRKLGDSIASMVKKFIGDKQSKSFSGVESGVKNVQGSGAAMASSVAAIGIGIAMIGAAAASIMAAVSSMPWWQVLLSLAAVVLVVSVPSMVLAWFKLRRRDLAAVLNASGWAINREMRFSMRLANGFTKCVKPKSNALIWMVVVLLIAVAAVLSARYVMPKAPCAENAPQPVAVQ